MMQSGRQILTVSNINRYIKSLLAYDANLSNIYVSGEISNFKRYASGHAYFSLKDAGGVLKCVMFQSAYAGVRFKPQDGMRVVAFGSISVYERDGVYQLYVQTLEPDGIGALYEQFERLKQELEAEGFFAPERKRALPLLPRAVAVVTSSSGAVIQDIRNVCGRRFPDMPVILYPASVQGEESVPEIVAAIERANREKRADVLIVGRGGGSIEDLWSFNDRAVAEAVYRSEIPVISAVGHETDYTICDFTADLRAPTPSAAAELAVPIETELRAMLDGMERKIRQLPMQNIRLKRAELQEKAANHHFSAPFSGLKEKQQQLMMTEDRLSDALSGLLEQKKTRIRENETKLGLLNPKAVLERGYAIVENKEGKALSSVSDLKAAGRASVVMRDGSVEVRTEERSGEDVL